jgi:hypothetical protein
MSWYNGYNGCKFFEPSLLENAGVVSALTATTNNSLVGNILNDDQLLPWISLGSNDTITEEINITFSTSQTVSRIFLLNFNFKDFKIFYNTNQNFAGVKTLDASGLSEINIVNNTKDVAYFEVTPQACNNIKIQAFNTIVANAQKFLGYLVITTEVGAISQHYMTKIDMSFDNNEKVVKALNNRYSIQKQQRTVSARIEGNFLTGTNYSLIQGLSARSEPFLFWACGGLPPSIFPVAVAEGWGLRDLFKMQVDSAFSPRYIADIFRNKLTASLALRQVN